MLTADDVIRAQARALANVLAFYQLDRVANRELIRIWQELECYGSRYSETSTLSTLYSSFHDLAFSACIGNAFRKTPTAAITVALFTFCSRSPEFRFLEPARLIASAIGMVRKLPGYNRSLQIEVFERLEDAFEAEIGTEVLA